MTEICEVFARPVPEFIPEKYYLALNACGVFDFEDIPWRKSLGDKVYNALVATQEKKFDEVLLEIGNDIAYYKQVYEKTMSVFEHLQPAKVDVVQYKVMMNSDSVSNDSKIILEKWKPEQPITCIYFDGEKQIYFIKRFLLENTTNVQHFMPSEHPKSFVENILVANNATAEITFAKIKGVEKDPETINIDEFITIKGIKAIGNQFIKDKVKTINIIIPEPEEEIHEGFDVVESTEGHISFIDEDVKDEDIPEEGTIGDLFEFPED